MSANKTTRNGIIAANNETKSAYSPRSHVVAVVVVQFSGQGDIQQLNENGDGLYTVKHNPTKAHVVGYKIDKEWKIFS